jgi:hypothetical protein
VQQQEGLSEKEYRIGVRSAAGSWALRNFHGLTAQPGSVKLTTNSGFTGMLARTSSSLALTVLTSVWASVAMFWRSCRRYSPPGCMQQVRQQRHEKRGQRVR